MYIQTICKVQIYVCLIFFISNVGTKWFEKCFQIDSFGWKQNGRFYMYLAVFSLTEEFLFTCVVIGGGLLLFSSGAKNRKRK